MITEDYVSFEIAKLLKEKGFDEASVMYYPKDGGEMTELDLYDLNYNRSKYIKCPTQAITMKWLREVHGLHVGIDPLEGNWCTKIVELEDLCEVDKGITLYGTYEEAAEAGIKYCLENLIQL